MGSNIKDIAIIGVVAVGGIMALKFLGGKGGLLGAAGTVSEAVETTARAAQTVGTGVAAVVTAPYSFGYGIGEWFAGFFDYDSSYPEDVVQAVSNETEEDAALIAQISAETNEIQKLEIYKVYLKSRQDHALNDMNRGIIDVVTTQEVLDILANRMQETNDQIARLQESPAPAPPPAPVYTPPPAPAPAPVYTPPPAPAPAEDIPPVNSPGYWTHLATTTAGNPAMQSYYEQQARAYENYQG